jgi:septal ring factor EnvC (AmiA/AmiB activator)
MNKSFVLLFLLAFTLGVAQPSDKQRKLEEQKQQIQKEIATFRQLLQNETKKEKSVLTAIANQKARIRLSEKLISTTAKQMRLLDDDIYLTQLQINKLNRELNVLKEDYAKMIVKSYKSRNDQSRVMFVLSSQNFLQAYKRIQYMKQYAGFRKMQGDEIQEKQENLKQAMTRLEANKKEKEKVLAESEAEKKELEIQKQEQEKLVKLIQKDKKKYAADINKKQKEAKAIDAQIKKLIAEAIAEANRKNSAKTGVKTPTATASSKFVLTPEGKIVSDNFKSNKGKLPWPVEKGYVYNKFGIRPHPTERNLTINNSGVEIATEKGSNARAVFEGEVLQIQVIKGTNRKIVIIQHGDFMTIYQNLETVNVRTGDKVAFKQNLGRIATDASGKAIIKFLITQNVTTLNPELWLANM